MIPLYVPFPQGAEISIWQDDVYHAPGHSIHNRQHTSGHSLDFALSRPIDFTSLVSPVTGMVVHVRKYEHPDNYGHQVGVEFERNGRRYVAVVSHMGEITVRKGQPIASGEKIGNMGWTGFQVGSHQHVHFEVYEAGYVNVSSRAVPFVFYEDPDGSVRGELIVSQNSTQPATLAEQIKGRVSVHRGGNNNLYISWDNNTGNWQHPPVSPVSQYGVSTAHAPVAVYDKYGRLNVFHVGGNGQVYQQILDGNSWLTKGTGLYTTHQPEVVLHEGYLNIFARGPQSQLLHVSSGDNVNWGGVRTIATNYPVLHKPTVAVRGSEMLVAYPTTNTYLATLYSPNGQQWTNRLVPGLRTRREIGLATYNGRFVMVHVGDNRRAYLNFTENTVNWSSAREVPGITVSVGIDLNVSNNLLHLSHGGADGQIYYQSSNTHTGTSWSTPRRQHYSHSTLNPVTLTGK